MADQKNVMTTKQLVGLVAATLALVALVTMVGMTLFGQAPQNGASNANDSFANQASVATNTNSNASEAAAAEDGASEEAADEPEGDEESQDASGDEGSAPAPSESASGDDARNAPGTGDAGSDAEPQPEPAPAGITVTVTINGANCGGGVSTEEVTISEGGTVFDALRATGASISGNGTYIRGINGLSEFQGGPRSGWFYYVNGVRPNVSCGSYVLSGGEAITWLYVNDWTQY